ncbi:MAG TPA: energy transducer TonB [Ferruginibacter sp.]|nr:energy transducer TonB [Ferruginibacter sp.]
MEFSDYLHLTLEHGAGFDLFNSFQNQPDMNKNFILKADILDIIFEKRNKDYGAYNLRKFYPNRLKLALGLMLLAAAAFSAFTFLPEKENPVMARNYEIPDTEMKKADPPKEPVKKEPVKKQEVVKPEVKATPVSQVKHVTNIVIVPKTTLTDTIRTIEPTDVIGTKTVVVSNPGTVFVPVNPDPGPGGPVVVKQPTDLTTARDADAVDVLPSYPGGMDALRKFLEKNLHTPDELENGQAVNVRVKFVVDYTGKLQSFVTVLDGGDAYNKEVVRVLKKMPDWIPGKANGENVPVYFTIPVKFVMTD